LRLTQFCAVLFAVLAVAPAGAGAAVPHVVRPGETLWSIAAANNLTTRTVAAYNGLSEGSQVVLGSTIQIPSTIEGYAALQKAGLVASAPQQATAAAAPTTAAAAPTTAAAAPTTAAAAPATAAAQSATSAGTAPSAQGGYTVRPGDTLSALAAGARVPLSAMAAINGLDPAGVLLAGTVIKLPSGAPAPVRASQPAPAATVVPQAAPEPSLTRVDASAIQTAASANGVSPSLAAAIGWQESGFNNAMVSGANARGVMQITPGTWDFVQTNLAGRRLDPASASDNVAAGVLYIKHLLQQTGGNETAAIACYYQGCGSVSSRGLFDDTKRYVANVQALRSRFGG
jgi:soluble lytic murein transglycosylase-like protein